MHVDEAHLNELKELINQSKRNESECGNQLNKFSWILLPGMDVTIIYQTSEINCTSGRVDLFIVAEEEDLTGKKTRQGYVWELKAPQLHLFEIDNNGRARPSKEFFDAENQLLHYYDTIMKDQSFLGKHDIFMQNIKFGGIVIGRKETFCKYDSPMDANRAKQLANYSLKLRESIFYKGEIKVLTWDKLIEIAEKTTMAYNKISVNIEEDKKIDVNATSSIVPSSTFGDLSVLEGDNY